MKYPKWQCSNYARTWPIEKTPDLLRQVAADLEHIEIDVMLNIIVNFDYGSDEATASVYLTAKAPIPDDLPGLK